MKGAQRAPPSGIKLRIGSPLCQRDRLADDRFLVTCPYCGEEVEIYLEPDVRGAFVQDCEVCCNPWMVSIAADGDERDVIVTRVDGAE